MSQGNENQFLQELLLDAIRKIDAVSDKVDLRIDALEERVISSHRDLRDNIAKRLDPLEKKVEDHTVHLTKHEHTFTVLGFLITGGIAGISGLFNWLGQFFGHK